MAINLNQPIFHAHDPRTCAKFVAEIPGLGPPVAYGPFLGVQTGNEMTLDFPGTDEAIQTQQYGSGA